jgi:hypothetical protein
MGMRQLKTQEGCDVTCGRAVMLYSGEEEVGAEPEEVLEVEDTDDWAIARGTRRNRAESFIVGSDVTELDTLKFEGGRRRPACLR